MKRFSFKFDRLKKIRERDEDGALLRLALAQTDLAREQKLLAELVESVANSGSRLLDLVKDGAARGLLGNADAYRQAALVAAQRQKAAAARASVLVSARQKEFEQAHQKAEAVRMLRDKRRTEHVRFSLRETQKELDEIGGRGASRKASRGM